jgi:hypothetical protein
MMHGQRYIKLLHDDTYILNSEFILLEYTVSRDKEKYEYIELISGPLITQDTTN